MGYKSKTAKNCILVRHSTYPFQY